MDKVNVNVSGCWTWTGVTGGSNARYGYFRPGGLAEKIPAHRFIYEWVRGSIPEGLEIDHLCQNKLCVNPIHLEAVPHKVNSNRVNWVSDKMVRNTDRDNQGRFVPKEGSSHRM